ncbi:Polysaccharide deacetylase family protein [Sulfidibacter corallicola]|uniref:Polysaccharide deacetylase family protein n=1 Tax=Sulfidibacter corallicola TaxID=2818388 RepID=A0A8A4TFQ6_SULCO|nr:polysaccharide deacetylase family protein [Sulfidibacter corallicola]QTD48357.1 polysaccharide deacetylase family protein [Sulfidibacter corallicola]
MPICDSSQDLKAPRAVRGTRGARSQITKGRIIGAWFLLLWSLPIASYGQSVALSFDDGLDPRTHAHATATNHAILKALAEAQVSSIFFVAGGRVDSPEGLALVRTWGESGHAVANHTYAHANYGSKRTTLAAFMADIERNERLLERYPGWTKRFRFPYLKEGETAEKRDGLRVWLKERGYRSGAVSIDASDWYYDRRYVAWRDTHPGGDPSAYRAAYLEHLWQRANYYDDLSQRLFGRSVPHVLLLHVNQINAAFLGDVVAMFRAKGWTLIDAAQAFQDPVYAMEPKVLPAGESLLWSLAKQRGMADLRYPAEDGRYEKPLLDKLGL